MILKICRRILRYMKILIHTIVLPILCICCLISRCVEHKYDIGMGRHPLINNIHWARALREYGYTVQTFVDDCYFITDEFDLRYDLGSMRIFKKIPALMFLRCIFSYRCCYFYFNSSPLAPIPILCEIEPLLFRLAGVKVVVMPYGSDSQILERTPNKLTVNCLCADYPIFFRTEHQRVTKQVDAWCRWADIVIGTMDSVDYLWFWNKIRQCCFAVNTKNIHSAPPPEKNNVVRIFHAPNHLNIKGTGFVLQAIEELKKEGYSIELVYKRGVSNKEILETVAQADIVVEQLVMGWHGIFGLEAMASGKPVICNLRPDLLSLYENAGCILPGELPMITASPITIKRVLKDLLDHPESWQEIGQRGRAYVEKYHSYLAVGGWFDQINREIGIYPSERNMTVRKIIEDFANAKCPNAVIKESQIES